MTLFCIISQIKRDIGRKARFLISHLLSTPQLGGLSRNTAITSGTQKLEWRSYHMMKKFEDMFTRFDTIHLISVTDERTSPHDGTGRAMHSVAR